MMISTHLDEPTAELDTPEPENDGAPERATLAAPPAPRAASRELPRPGAVLCGRYLLEYQLGAGGSAVVFAASDLRAEATQSPARVALKLVRPDLHCIDIATERLKREYRLAQVLSHPNLIHAYELDCDDGRWFMTMELLEGQTLAAALKNAPEALGTQRALDILRACSQALTFAHEHGVVHGDLKPANIFLTHAGEVRVLDLGAATETDPAAPRQRPAASAHYASPEVATGLRPDHRDDVFSFACIAYELLSGRHPFGRPPLSARAQGLQPVRAWNLTDRQWYPLEAALSFDRNQRPASIRALCADLFSREVAPPLPTGGEVAQAPELDAFVGASNPFAGDRNGLSAFGIAAVAAALLLTGVAVYSQLDRNPDWMPAAQDKVGETVQDLREHVQDLQQRLETDADMTPAATPASSNAGALPRAEASPPADSAPAAPRSTPPQTTAPRTATPPPATATPRASRTRTAAVDTAAPLAPIFISFQTERVTVREGADSAVITLKRDASMMGRTYVHWRVIPGSARPGQDYAADAGGRADFADNQPLRAIYVPLLRDGIAEPPEEFFIELYNAGPDTRIWPVQRAAVTILDDD